MKVSLPILYYSDGNALADLDIIEHTKVVKQQVFYSIDSIAPAKDETYIYSGGETFVCPKSVGEVERLIDKAKNQELITIRNN